MTYGARGAVGAGTGAGVEAGVFGTLGGMGAIATGIFLLSTTPAGSKDELKNPAYLAATGQSGGTGMGTLEARTKPVSGPPPVEGARDGDVDKSGVEQWIKTGNYEDAKADQKKLCVDEPQPRPSRDRKEVLVCKDAEGRYVNARDKSSVGPPTIEIQNPRDSEINSIKIRYVP